MSINGRETLKTNVNELFYFKRARAIGIPLAVFAYLTYVLVSFDIMGPVSYTHLTLPTKA